MLSDIAIKMLLDALHIWRKYFMIKLVVVRHGESIWNYENIFTGWTDIDLSDNGVAEAKRAGKILKKEGYLFDIAFASVLKRAIKTLWYILDGNGFGVDTRIQIMEIERKALWRITGFKQGRGG